ncbi:hypothetical protein SSE37_07603 [Sagittula stellata E-37]|uniref:Uncharacterized protein n=1 Tax=Sagittula stellata (strain ATCC 700073 / DSM 11524 / E-37) TaxID=388399 RepID=A3JYV2_SAGS3|nr:hypothetical protein SSE37_07603 [Sagittula stellata E-37]
MRISEKFRLTPRKYSGLAAFGTMPSAPEMRGYDMADHRWLLEVLADIHVYACANALPMVAKSSQAALTAAEKEVSGGARMHSRCTTAAGHLSIVADN